MTITRAAFALLQAVFGLLVPGLYATSLTVFRLADASAAGVAYWLGLPALCFLVLAGISLLRRPDRFRFATRGIWGAALTGYLAFAVPAVATWLTTGDNYRGGGANIGVALLVVALPIYLPFVMLVGFALGQAFKEKTSHQTEVDVH